jgi:hypothetical protein
MPTIATELGRIATIDIGAVMSGVARDGRLGIGMFGPLTEWNTVNVLLYDLLNALQWDVDKAAKNLDPAARDFREHDEQITAELTQLLEQLNHNPREPW